MSDASVDGFDVVVIGGGPAGAAAAAGATRAGASVALFDRVRSARFRVGEGAPPGTIRLLHDVFGNEARAFHAPDHLPSYGTVSVWGEPQPHSQDYVFHPDGHGWHLDRARFDARLLGAARELGIDVSIVEVPVPLRRDGSWWRIGDHRARFVVDATGRPAVAARSVGGCRVVDDQLVAVVGVRACSDQLDGATHVEATASGWWYTAVIPGGRQVVTFLTDADLLPRRARTRHGFSELVETTTHISALVDERSGRWSDLRVVAADTATLHPIGGARWLATGDAAASFDPLSSQGIITALRLGVDAGRVAVEMLGDAGGGGLGPLETYRATRDLIVAEHLATRRSHYQDEQRWPDRPFWARRHRSDGDAGHRALGRASGLGVRS